MASLSPELIANIGGFPVTNTIVATVLIDVVILLIVITVIKNLTPVPKALQSIFEITIEYFYDLTEQIAGSKVKSIFPWFASFFLFIAFANFIALLPGFGSIGFWRTITEHGKKVTEFTPLLRAATSDFNLTFALGTVSVIATHVIAYRYNGLLGYLKKFLSLNPIYLFIGILEFSLEAVKVVSLSFRLFGNIYAGEVVLSTVSGMFAFLAPIPFLMLESITAIVQALVFSMLTMVFMSLLATTQSEGGGH